MTRHINFRDDCNVSFSCISDHILYLFLSIKSAITCFLGFFWFRSAGSKTTMSFNSPCAYFSKFRKCFNLYSPPFIISQMPMKNIHFIGSHLIEIGFYFFNGKKVSAYIKHEPSPFKSRVILNNTCFNFNWSYYPF